jgi:hypothetical protein
MTIAKCVDAIVDDFDHGPSDEIPGLVWYVRDHR